MEAQQALEHGLDKRFALLIDADNVSAKYIKPILNELNKYGTVTYKRIYGDWTLSLHAKWKDALLENSITPIQQFSYTYGKNSTDSAMIIDAMDILYAGGVEGFCIVSSDSDFTRLASRLRESGRTVIGMGEKKTPTPFRKACDIFTVLELLIKNERSEKANGPTMSKAEVEQAVVDIIVDNQNNGKATGLGEIGSRLQKRYPDFDVRNYGTNLLSKLLGEFTRVKITKDHSSVAVELTDAAEAEKAANGDASVVVRADEAADESAEAKAEAAAEGAAGANAEEAGERKPSRRSRRSRRIRANREAEEAASAEETAEGAVPEAGNVAENAEGEGESEVVPDAAPEVAASAEGAEAASEAQAAAEPESSVEAEAPAKPVRKPRRRRKAAAGGEVAEASDGEGAPAESPVGESAPAEASEAEAPSAERPDQVAGQEADAERPARKPRRRRKAEKALEVEADSLAEADMPEKAKAVEADSEAAGEQVASEAQTSAGSEPAPKAEEAAKPARKPRRQKKAPEAAPEPEAELEVGAEPADAASEPAAAKSEPEAPAKPARKPRRRKKAASAEAEPVSAPAPEAGAEAESAAAFESVVESVTEPASAQPKPEVESAPAPEAELESAPAPANDPAALIRQLIAAAGAEGIALTQLGEDIRAAFKDFKVRELGFPQLRLYIASIDDFELVKDGKAFRAKLRA